MEKIYLGSGVYRSKENTTLFEVYTPEQMEHMRLGTAYEDLKNKKQGGGFHGVKVLGRSNKHGRMEFENKDQVTEEQFQIIQAAISIIDPPQKSYNEERMEIARMQHDHSKDAELAKDDNLPAERSEGTNVSEDGIDPTTGETDEDDDSPLDEDFIDPDDEVDEDGNDDGPGEDEPGADSEDGYASFSTEPTEPAAGATDTDAPKSGKKSSAK